MPAGGDGRFLEERCNNQKESLCVLAVVSAIHCKRQIAAGVKG
jgi:hypothetical protein